jgi:MFS family permease
LPRRAWRYGLTSNIVVLGVVSLLTDFSSEMIVPILPFFLITALGANALIVGLIEGTGDAVVAFLKVASGRWSDVAGSRKRFVEAGYGLSTVMKILFPFAQAWPQFLAMRVAERLGKGVRDAPRDALLTESTPAETRGKAFGFHRSMDTAGAIIGPIATLVLLAVFLPVWAEGTAYRLIILIAALPAALSLVCIAFVREPLRAAVPQPRFRASLRSVPRPLVLFLGIASVFSFADFSYAFLLLRVTDVGQSTVVAILLYVLFNAVYAAHAFPAGVLSDRVGRKPVILVGYGAFVVMGVLLAATPNLVTLVLGFILYGLSYGMAEGTQRALVADLAPQESKGTVLGAYHTSVGIVKLASGIVAGLLWVAVAPAATFWFGAGMAGIAAALLLLWRAPATSAASARGPPRPA